MSDDGLNVGDVLIYFPGGWGTRSLVKIDRLTPTQIIVGGRRFRRKGNGYGSHFSYREIGTYSRGSLWPADAEAVAEIKDEQRRRELIQRIEQVRWDKLATEQLAAIVAALPSVEASR